MLRLCLIGLFVSLLVPMSSLFGQCSLESGQVMPYGYVIPEGSSARITLDIVAQPGVRYTLYHNEQATNQIQWGATADSLVWSVTETGVYTVIAQQDECQQLMAGYCAVSVYPLTETNTTGASTAQGLPNDLLTSNATTGEVPTSNSTGCACGGPSMQPAQLDLCGKSSVTIVVQGGMLTGSYSLLRDNNLVRQLSVNDCNQGVLKWENITTTGSYTVQGPCTVSGATKVIKTTTCTTPPPTNPGNPPTNCGSGASIVNPTSGPPTDLCQGSYTLTASKTRNSYKWCLNSADCLPTSSSYLSGSKSITVSQSGTYYLTTPDDCGKASTTSIPLTIKTPMSSVTLTGPATACQQAGASQYTVQGINVDAYTWSNTALSGNSLKIIQRTRSGSTYTEKIEIGWNSGANGKLTLQADAYGCADSKITKTLSIDLSSLPQATVTPSGTTTIAWPNRSLLLKANAGTGYTYQWYKDNVAIGGTAGTQRDYSATAQGKCKVVISAGNCAKITSAETIVLLDNDNNYVVHRQFQAASSDLATVQSFSQDQKHEVFSYFDGLGRPLQTVNAQYAPGKQDLITFTEYDAAGRISKDYLPYRTDNKGKFRKSAVTEQATFYNPSNTDVAADGRASGSSAFTQTIYEASPLNRISQLKGPGAWQSHPTQQTYATNVASVVKLWSIGSDGLPTTSSTYAANLLFVQTTLDEDNQATTTYTNKLGQVILTQTSPTSGVTLSTYRIYDERQQLRFVLPPNAVEKYALISAGTLTRQQWAEAYTYRYYYDTKGRLEQKAVPATGIEYYIYDERDRLVLSQSARQRQQSPKEWTFTAYDGLNRVTRTGIYRNSGTLSEVRGQSFARAGSVPPTGTNTVLQYRYYDDYSQAASHLFKSDRGVSQHSSAKGLLTFTSTNVIGTTTYLKQALYYDTQGRVVQTVADNYVGGKDIVTSQYSFNGLLLRQEREHTSSSSYGNRSFFVTTYNTFDHGDRLTQVRQRIETTRGGTVQADNILAEYRYNSLGQQIEKNLSKQSTQFLQSIDYRYNLRGWLETINDVGLGSTSGNPDSNVSGDLFGMRLYYNATTITDQKARYNGNISAATWRQKNSSVVRSYRYDYDRTNRLLDAYFQQRSPSASTWESANSNFETRGIAYDANGNIKSLSRYDGNNALMDKLTYSYGNTTGDRLLQVKDEGQATVGFTERSTSNYEYDGSGNLTKNADKQITSIQYNHLNLPMLVTLSEGRSIAYAYSAEGVKLAEEVKYADGQKEITSYVDGIVYYRAKGQSSSQLDFIAHAEGRTKAAAGGKWVAQFDIKDHLGNTRVTFNAGTTTTTVTASSETGGEIALTEEAVFENVAETRTTQAYHNSTAASAQEPNPNKVALLNPVAGTVVGPANSQRVSAGDSVHLTVVASYEEGNAATPQGLTSVATMVASALTASPTAGLEAVQVAQAPIQEALAGATLLNDDGSHVPKAYLNYLLFDTAYQLIDQGFVQVSEAAKVEVGKPKKGLLNGKATPQAQVGEQLVLDINVPQDGILYTYVSNESNWDAPVMMDNLTVATTTVAPVVIDQQDYYAFGMTFQQPLPGQLKNRYLFNGKELSNDFGLGMYDYGARSYDPAIGRWSSVDPAADLYYSLSAYSYVANNPIKNVDPDGRIIGTVVGGIVGGVAGGVNAYFNGGSITAGIVEGGVGGAIAGAVVDLTVATGGVGLAVVGAAVAGGALGAVTGDIAGQVTNGLIRDKSLSESLSSDNINFQSTADKAISGAVSGLVGGVAGAGVNKLLGAAAKSSQASLKKVGEALESTAESLYQQGASQQTVQTTLNRMTTSMGRNGKAAANGVAAGEAFTTGTTETVLKTDPIQQATGAVKDAANQVLNFFNFGNK